MPRTRNTRSASDRSTASSRRSKTRSDTEYKLVAGEFVLFLLENGEYDRHRFMTRLDKYLDDNRRRSLFGLPAVDETPETRQTGMLPCRLLNKGLVSLSMSLS